MGPDPYTAFLTKQAIVITVFWAVVLYLSYRPDFDYEDQMRGYGILIFLFSAGTFFVIKIFGYIICIVIVIGAVCYLINYRLRVVDAEWKQTGSFTKRPFPPANPTLDPTSQVKRQRQNNPSQNKQHSNVRRRKVKLSNTAYKEVDDLSIGLDAVKNSRFKGDNGWGYFGIHVRPDLATAKNYANRDGCIVVLDISELVSCSVDGRNSKSFANNKFDWSKYIINKLRKKVIAVTDDTCVIPLRYSGKPDSYYKVNGVKVVGLLDGKGMPVNVKVFI